MISKKVDKLAKGRWEGGHYSPKAYNTEIPSSNTYLVCVKLVEALQGFDPDELCIEVHVCRVFPHFLVELLGLAKLQCPGNIKHKMLNFIHLHNRGFLFITWKWKRSVSDVSMKNKEI